MYPQAGPSRAADRPERRTLPTRTVETFSCRPISRTSYGWPLSRARRAPGHYHQSIQFSSAQWMSSSVKPSLKYSVIGLRAEVWRMEAPRSAPDRAVPAGATGSALFAEDRHIASLRKLDNQLCRRCPSVVALQLSSVAGAPFHSNDRVHARIIRRFPVEHLDPPDHVLFELFPIGRSTRPFDREPGRKPAQFRAEEANSLLARNPLQVILDRSRRQRRVDMVSPVSLGFVRGLFTSFTTPILKPGRE